VSRLFNDDKRMEPLYLFIFYANSYMYSVIVFFFKFTSVVKVRGARGGSAPPASTSAPLLRLGPLLESEPSLPTAGPKLLNSTKNHNVRCRINKF